MKNMIKIGCILVVLALGAGLLAGCTEPTNTTAKNDRETSVSGETKNTVNPDVSEPNQSIASGALIPDQTTTETTTETPSGNTYNLRGKDFTLSVHLEDYIYKLAGADCVYFDLERLMNQYGYSYEDEMKSACNHYVYGNDSLMISIPFRSNPDGTNEASGNPICGYINLTYRSSYDGYLGVGCLTGAGSTDRLFEINGIVYEGENVSSYCLTWEQIVLLCVVLDDYTKNGTTENAMNQIMKVFEYGTRGGGGDAIRLN